MSAQTLASIGATIDAQNRLFEQYVKAQDTKSLADKLYAPNARLMPASGPDVVGREGIAAFFGEVIKAGVRGVKLETFELIPFGDVATATRVLERGAWTMLTADGTQIDTGKFIVVKQKGEDGQFYYEMDMFSSSVTPPAKEKEERKANQ